MHGDRWTQAASGAVGGLAYGSAVHLVVVFVSVCRRSGVRGDAGSVHRRPGARVT